MKFSANLGFLFLEGSCLIEQFYLAAKSGFRYVEFPFPAENVDLSKLLEAKNNLGLEGFLM
jgi:hydroxypyruvate isomerase